MKGIGTVTFGMKADEIEKLMGKPNEVEDFDEDDEFASRIWHYWNQGLSLFFEGENLDVFTSLEIDLEDTTLFGKEIFKMSEKQIIELMKSKGFEEIDEEEHEWGEKRISFDDALIDFYFQESKLTSVNFGVIDLED